MRESSMTEPRRPKIMYVIGPDGSPLTVADLPAPGTKRWVIRRKAEVVAAVSGGLLSAEEACSRYTLTVDEIIAWQRSIERHGLAGAPHHPHPTISPARPYYGTPWASKASGRNGLSRFTGSLPG